MASREKIDIRLVGVDGSVWDLSGRRGGTQGVWLDRAHTGFITDTPVETVWQSSVGQIGGTFRGMNFAPREITLPVMVLDDKSRAWQETDSQWRRAWSYREDSILQVMSGDSVRSLRVRLKATPEQKLEESSGQERGASLMLMHLIAGDPLWSSETVTEPWIFDGVHWTGNVTVTNPTDMPMWLKWTVTGPASIILPDFSFESRPGYPGFDQQRRRIVLPHLRYRWDAVVDSDPTHEQLAVVGKPNFWMLLEKPFLYPVPPRTPPTELPLAVNPLPLLPEVWKRLDIPFEIPVEFLVKMAEILERILTGIGLETLEQWSADGIAIRTRKALEEAAEWAKDKGIAGEWLSTLLRVLSKSKLAELIGEAWGHAWGSAFNMPGAGVQVRMERRWTRPYGLE
ncbi:hypothetical protein CCICO_04440 [Corynebacterium ciconiae DSM 44920]|uniref:hypothetical protein n=2 Tax=Corynebacterium ciconiae TaxID=227319 RepID=UPI002649B495|nr:hypothetical protein [Corynebacterium ciconiae]WKD60925.1 hypothetical protein CCICO_04440 [Corynebacterium ciconiae DSM 44920]